MDNFFEFEPLPKDIKQKSLDERKKVNESGKRYANNDAYKKITGEDIFNFEENKKKLIADLDWLTKISVEEFTFRKKWEEMQLLTDYITDFDGQAKAQIWAPTDLENEELTIKEIAELQPKVVVVEGDYLERLWTTLRYYCSSAEYNQAPGRFIKFLMMDEKSGRVLGVSSIASDVICISDRDKYLGWTPEDKLKQKMLKHSAIGTTIVPTQPFGSNFLGGKLIAALITSKKVRDEWEFPRAGESNPAKLVGMTTTSLYGGFSMYNSLKWWKPVGMSKGKIPIKPYEKGYHDWHQWLKQFRKDDYEKAMTQKDNVSGPVTGAKMRVLSMIFQACKIKQSEYCHGFTRGVYYSCFYENTKEFLQRKITEAELVMKPLFKEDRKSVV